MNDIIDFNDNWSTITQFFPAGWEEKAKELGSLHRRRKFKSASDLMRVLLIHLATDSSLVETVVKSKYGNLADVSDVAILKRLRNSGSWFNWMSTMILKQRGVYLTAPNDFDSYNIRTVDASVISEPGSTGSNWRLHYSMQLFSLQPDQFIITNPNIGESILNFEVNSNDLVIGDRAYCNYKGIKYITDSDAFFLLRFKKNSFSLININGDKINLLLHLRKLKVGETLDLLSNCSTANQKEIPLRIIAIKKSKKEAEKSRKRAIKENKRKQKKIYETTIEYHEYIILATNLPKNIPSERILELYRLRWQIELSFKRLKSIFGLGHLPKKDQQSAIAWLQGKLFIAILIQKIIDESQFFSPWGYPISTE